MRSWRARLLEPVAACSPSPAPGPRPPSSSGLDGSTITLAGIEGPLAAQPVAVFAGAVRAVEGERARLELRHAGAAFGARQLLRVEPLFAVDHRDQHQAVGQLGGGLDGRFQALLDARLHQQPVHHHLDGVVLALVERGSLRRASAARRRCARGRSPGARAFPDPSCIRPCGRARSGARIMMRSSGLQRQDVLQDLLRGLPRDLRCRRPGSAARRWRSRAGAGSRRFR